MSTTETTWNRVVALAGTVFSTKTGKTFTYDISGNSVALGNTNRMIPRSHIERAVDRSPLTGPGQLQDLQGPSYVYAIVTDPRVRGARVEPTPSQREESVSEGLQKQEMTYEKSAYLGAGKPGFQVTERDLRNLGFSPFELQWLDPVSLPSGTATNWNTLGKIPSGAGLYAFTTEIRNMRDALRVRYVGMTTDLWMVTKGRLPDGTARGGQRYGRRKHSGDTRKRVNIELTTARAEGLHVRHWLRSVDVPDGTDAKTLLRQEEARLIWIWNLRSVGWNRR